MALVTRSLAHLLRVALVLACTLCGPELIVCLDVDRPVCLEFADVAVNSGCKAPTAAESAIGGARVAVLDECLDIKLSPQAHVPSVKPLVRQLRQASYERFSRVLLTATTEATPGLPWRCMAFDPALQPSGGPLTWARTALRI